MSNIPDTKVDSIEDVHKDNR